MKLSKLNLKPQKLLGNLFQNLSIAPYTVIKQKAILKYSNDPGILVSIRRASHKCLVYKNVCKTGRNI